MANPQSKPYFSPKNWLYSTAYGVNGKRYSQQPARDYEVNKDGTITAYGGTHIVQTDSQGRKYFDILIPETTNPHGLQRGFNHKDSLGRVIGRGETYNRYYINNLVPAPPQPETLIREPVIVEEPVIVTPKPKENTNIVYSPNEQLSGKESVEKGKPKRAHLGDGEDHITKWNYYNSPEGRSVTFESSNGLYMIDNRPVTKQRFTQYTDSLRQFYDDPIIEKSDTIPGQDKKRFIIQHRNFNRKDNNKIDKQDKTVAIQETPNKADTVLGKLRNLFGFKLGGIINYLKFYN